MNSFWINPSDLASLTEAIGGKEVMEKVISVLSSGKYTQHRQDLTLVDDEMSGCCLYVVARELDGLCHSDAILWDVEASREHPSQCAGITSESVSNIMEDFADIVILTETKHVERTTFSMLNDEYLTHLQIADLLRGKVLEVEIL